MCFREKATLFLLLRVRLERAAVPSLVRHYWNPPDNAVVLSVNEKPHIQALERVQGWLRLPDGKALTGFNHEHKRHGTSTLFAALEVATGQVKAGHFQRRRRRDFLAFRNELWRPTLLGASFRYLR